MLGLPGANARYAGQISCNRSGSDYSSLWSRYGGDPRTVGFRWRMLMQQFLKTLSLPLAMGAMLATAACHHDRDDGDKDDGHHATMISDADAAKATDATVAAWQSMDGAKIDALYAPDVVGFDPDAAALSTDRANWTKLQQGFAGMKFDHVAVSQSKTQILDGEDFIFSSVSNLTSTAGSVKSMGLRCTDVFRKQDDGKFLIVNEHCSTVPHPTA